MTTSTNHFWLINHNGVRTLCVLKRGKLCSYDTVHIVDGFAGGDTGRTLDEWCNGTGKRAVTIEWVTPKATNKQAAINKCKELLAQGIYAVPVFACSYGDYMVKVNHDARTFGYELSDWTFLDCTFDWWAGVHNTIDFPLFYLKG